MAHWRDQRPLYVCSTPPSAVARTAYCSVIALPDGSNIIHAAVVAAIANYPQKMKYTACLLALVCTAAAIALRKEPFLSQRAPSGKADTEVGLCMCMYECACVYDIIAELGNIMCIRPVLS